MLRFLNRTCYSQSVRAQQGEHARQASEYAAHQAQRVRRCSDHRRYERQYRRDEREYRRCYQSGWIGDRGHQRRQNATH